MRYHSVLSLMLAACGGAEAPSSAPGVGEPADTLTILHSSRIDGEIEPCG